ncbi:hypothetical protein FA15DRAFT_676905 [Coprinopsis marcescibilis]|uniref:DH domain-containing protein n=1 Tax=Coprinopsis marcescibilis TaxID=230819 RepID=A0A5C3LC38_COPMA|nr:hypothetical protein FA15DRAFT_676905 [Coprinopsis marcescibilis]
MASGDFNHVHIAAGDEEPVAMGITSDEVVQLLSKDAPHARPIQSRAPVDHSRWSDAYSSSARSRSSSIGNNSNGFGHDMSGAVPAVPPLQQKPSYDIMWRPADERDEVGMSEEETDDEPVADDVDSSFPGLLEEEERTSAAVVAEEGRALIVHAENTPVVQLQPQPGTTHLLMGSSTTPNAVPQFLTNALPLIATTLLALDISANFLGALPPVLADCENLEELNVASNPLRVLPVFLAELSNLRVLIADATGINTLPEALVDLEKLHTLSIRRNKLNSLPSWLCLLPVLQTLCVDGNPFQGPWKALVDPLLAKIPMTPSYPPSTPMFPLPSAGLEDDPDTDTEETSDYDSSHPHRSGGNMHPSIEEEDHTITPERAPILSRSITSPSPLPGNDPPPQPRPLQRTRTTPNRSYFESAKGGGRIDPTQVDPPQVSTNESTDREVRKMKSAGDLRRAKLGGNPHDQSGGLAPLSNYSTSASSSNLLNLGAPPVPTNAMRFASLGPSSNLGPVSRPPGNSSRPQLSKSMWDGPPNASSESNFNPMQRNSYASSNQMGNHPPIPIAHEHKSGSSTSRRPSRDGKEKSRWGFLKKMSMGKIKPDNPPVSSSPGPSYRPSTAGGRPPMPVTTSNPHIRPPMHTDRLSRTPQIDVRFSTTGMLDLPVLNKQPSRDLLKPAPPAPAAPSHPPASSDFLSPPAPTPRRTKRRSFLPFEQPGTLSIPIPDVSTFVPNVTATNGTDDHDSNHPLASPTTPVIDAEQFIRKEEERIREAYMRALRSVMAYLKDMNDLAQSQQPNPVSVYGDESFTVSRSRRPTVVDRNRENSMFSNGSSDASSQLRSSESISALRSGNSSMTLSVATTDSASSMDERKYKDDKAKRAWIIKEILTTERTYVNHLQELIEVYIKPASLPVNMLSGVGPKDTVVPPAERKAVFGGIDALLAFHQDSFLPALERVAAPLFAPNIKEMDADGKLTLEVSKAVGDTFVKHAAFMRMYSSYINNFDHSMQRMAAWTTGGTSSPGSAISPSSSTAHLVGLTMSISGSAPPVEIVGPALTSSQKKRIKAYVKRCRANPRHSQLDLNAYLLLPVQRIPRYKLLLTDLLKSTPPMYDYMEDSLDRALAEISSLASNINEGKRDAESRKKLVQWQSRIRGKFPSPLVQPHRRLIMDGPLLLTRVVRKAVVSFEAINPQGDSATVQVDCLAPELTPRPLVGVLCNDLLVLCRDPSEGKDPNSFVDLWAVLRMQTLPQPASIVHGNALRLVDNKAILYFDAPTPSDALNWYRAINLHIPASKA